MLGSVHVLDAPTWERYLRDLPLDPRDKKRVGAELGEYLYVQNNCKGCHSSDGAKNIGPTFKDLFGRNESLADGSTVNVDDNYIRKSIIDPKADVVAGFPDNQMTSYDGILSETEIKAIIDYIKTLKD
jgi:cytochrome c oxidase subunit 2